MSETAPVGERRLERPPMKASRIRCSVGGGSLRDVGRHEWERGYYCAVAALIRQEGMVTTQIRELYHSGGNADHADECDKALFRITKLMPTGALTGGRQA